MLMTAQMDLADIATNVTSHSLVAEEDEHPPVNYGNPYQRSPHPDLGYFQVRQHIQHGPHTRTVIPIPPSLSNVGKRASDHSLSPQKHMKRARSGEHRSQGGQGGNTRWTDDERTVLFNYYLGPESGEVFIGLKMNATHAHKKVRVSIHSCDISLF
jgi:hypothetical protein